MEIMCNVGNRKTDDKETVIQNNRKLRQIKEIMYRTNIQKGKEQ